MNTIFLIGDTHFGHTKILEFEKEKRPFSSIEEMNETLVENWNKVVKPKDTIWHLGDVLFGIENFKYLARLNGYKHLVMGNHDGYPIEEYQKYFNKIVGGVRLAGHIMSHIPVHPSQKYRFTGNIHGHLHSNVVTKEVLVDTGIGELPESIPDPWYVNVSAEQHNLTPVELNVLLKGRETKYKETTHG